MIKASKTERLIWAYVYTKQHGSLDPKAYKTRFGLTNQMVHYDLGTGRKDFIAFCNQLDANMPYLAGAVSKLIDPHTLLGKVPVATVPEANVSYINISFIVHHDTKEIEYQPFTQEVFDAKWVKLAGINFDAGCIDN